MVIKFLRRLNMILPVVILLTASGCRSSAPVPTALPSNTPSSPAPVIATPTHLPPTQTLVPLAAQVNGEGITLQEYQAELDRYQTAVGEAGTNMATEEEQRVLEDIIDQVLLAQAAAEAGFVVDQTALDNRLEQLADELGGWQILLEWMADNGYSQEDFQRSMSRAMAAAWMRDRIVNAVPERMDQVHARQILVFDAETAQNVLTRLSSGKDFEDLAYEFDPVLGGDLGWFPKGYLAQAALNEVIFNIEPGEISAVIETELGFHIIQVIEKAVERPLSPDAWLSMQVQALRSWLGERRNQSDLQYFLP
ncbi:MAG: peptidylprolyl isomerase [Anaerolineales bacterium]|jgi:peptidyl-prolyl cis-trans isomerase C